MMSSGTFEGRILINGTQEADSVRVHLNDFEIGITDPAKPMFARRILTLHPCSPKMFSWAQDVDALQEGVYYAVNGTRLGLCEEGLVAHAPGITRTGLLVTGFALRARFTAACLSVEIDGRLAAGRRLAGLESAGAGTFHVDFRVPRRELPGFLQLDPQDWQYLAEHLDQLPGHASPHALEAAHDAARTMRALS